MLDFNNIPAGTPVSAGNPYAGVLNLSGQTTALLFSPPNITSEAIIADNVPYLAPGNKAIQAQPVFVEGAAQYSSEVTGTFLQPVVNVSFDAYAFRTAAYDYSATDGLGDFFSGSGTILGDLDSGGTVRWQQINLSTPSGFYVTDFSVLNEDVSPGSAAVWVDNVAFAIVPEPGTNMLLALALVGGLLGRRLIGQTLER